MTIYLDYAATTPLDDQVFETMLPYFKEVYGNPSSLHKEGQRVRHAVETAREQVAVAIGAKPQEIIFSSGATEADNHAIRAVIEGHKLGKKAHLMGSGAIMMQVIAAQELLEAIDKKYAAMGQDANVHLSGLLHAEPMKYWDFIQLDALLGLQTQRTNLPDEMVFLMYHQVNELLFKMILWEMQQISHTEDIKPEKFVMHLSRISRYFDMLSSSFTVMGDGMEYEQYMKFRDTLTPASGFQSAQYRLIEFCSTELINLIDYRFRAKINRDTPFEHAFEHLYWQAAGKDYKTGEKSFLLDQFEEKYKAEFLRTMKEYNTINLWSKFKSLPKKDQKDKDLLNAMRHLDYTINIQWVMSHYEAAGKYIGSTDEATGGSEWRKYMHPKYQKRIFFPDLWSKEEFENWGVTNLENYKILT